MFSSRAFYGLIVAATIVSGASVAYANGILPDITVGPNGNVEVHQDGLGTATASPNPLSGPPRIQGQTGNKDIDNFVKNVDGAAHLPQEAASAIGDAAAKAVEGEISKLIEQLKQKFWAQVEEWRKLAMPYVYLVAGALLLILMLPGLIGALFAIWVVRRMDSRRARKQDAELKKALAS